MRNIQRPPDSVLKLNVRGSRSRQSLAADHCMIGYRRRRRRGRRSMETTFCVEFLQILLQRLQCAMMFTISRSSSQPNLSQMKSLTVSIMHQVMASHRRLLPLHHTHHLRSSSVVHCHSHSDRMPPPTLLSIGPVNCRDPSAWRWEWEVLALQCHLGSELSLNHGSSMSHHSHSNIVNQSMLDSVSRHHPPFNNRNGNNGNRSNKFHSEPASHSLNNHNNNNNSNNLNSHRSNNSSNSNPASSFFFFIYITIFLSA